MKVLKLNIDDINIDITYKQYGGILTLCFLEELDSMFKNFFKVCIILAKIYIHYECRLLGSNNGLLAT